MEIKPRAKRGTQGGAFGAGAELTDTKAAFGADTKTAPAENAAEKAAFRGSQTGFGPLGAAASSGKPAEITPGTQIGEYEVEAKIGEGAMGTVYRAIHPAIHKRVAIKIMTPKVFDEPESVKRFVAEARAVAAIEHPGIVDVFGFGRIPDGRTYLVMEWLEGQSLGVRLQQSKLEWTEACEIIRQIARALEAAHAKGIVHRDLKPENVFIQQIDDDKPVVKLLDFGLAKTTNKEDALVAKTRTGQLLGTPLYMSPEQCKSKGVDHRTDIYALGCMSYEMLLGRTPFDADNVAELISAHLVGEPPKPTSLKPDLAPELDKLLSGMIAKEPDKRPPLGEIRRVIGMQLSRPSQPIGVVTPPDGVDAMLAGASGPFVQPARAPSASTPSLPQQPGAATADPASTTQPVARHTPAQIYGIVALVVVIAAVALIAVLR